MLNNINIWCEDGKIKITWNWKGSVAERVDIFYKKMQGSPQGEGTAFNTEGINRVPHIEVGHAERRLGEERGLYSFTFLVRDGDGNPVDRLMQEGIMLGTVVEVFWHQERNRKGDIITFRFSEKDLPEGILRLKIQGACYVVHASLSDGAKLLFPQGLPENDWSMELIEPYNKVYRLRQGRINQ